MERDGQWESRAAVAAACMVLAFAPACDLGAHASAAVDAGVDAGPEGAIPPADAPADSELPWVVSARGAVTRISMTIDGAGNILVAARQIGEVTIGDVHVPAPASFEAVLVFKLTATGTAVWARSFDGHRRCHPRAIATTPSGDVVVGATTSPAPVLGIDDGLVILLDGNTGATRWSAALASTWDDRVAGVAAGTDAAGDMAIYVYGQFAGNTVISGQALAAGAYLIRYDEDGALRWAHSFPSIDSGFKQTLALDPARGPVVIGDFGGDLTLGDQTLAEGGTVVAGFDPDGNVRLVRQLMSSGPSLFHSVAVAPGGDVYVWSADASSP